LTIGILLILSFLQAIHAQPVPIGATIQSNPFESNPTAGSTIGSPTGGFTGTPTNAMDGDFATNINWRIGGGATGVTTGVEMTPFNNAPPTTFSIGWVDIKMNYKASSTTDDRYRILYQVGGSAEVVLQDWISRAPAKFDHNGAQDERAWSNVAEPNDGVWDWTDISNAKVRVETQRQGATEDSSINRFYLHEVWLSTYEGSYPPLSPSNVSIQPSVVSGLFAGDIFFVDVFVTNVTNLHGFQFLITYDTAVLTGVDYFAYNPFILAAPSEINDTAGYVAVSFSSWMGDTVGFTGSEPVVRIYFLVDSDGISLLHFGKSILSNVLGERIEHTLNDGVFTSVSGIHDIAVTGVGVTPTAVAPGESVAIYVTVWNQGTFPETFNVTVYYDSTAVGPPQTVTSMSPGTSQTLNFVWDTTGVSVGRYLIKAEASVVAGEIDTSDNLREGGFVNIGYHDVAVTSVLAIPPNVTVGQPVSIDVGILNEGAFTETFNVTVFYDSSPIETQTITSLPATSGQALTFIWNTTGISGGTYFIRAEASSVPDEIDIADNTYIDGSVTIVVPPPPSEYTRIYLPNQWVSDGTPMGWHADDYSWPYTLPFDFPFYGTYYRTIYISSNGLVSFTGFDASYGNSIDWLRSKLAITPAWEDWQTYNSPYDIYIWQPDPDHIIIRWYVQRLGTSINANFEAILGQDGVIQFNYGYNDGSITATTGISNGVDDILAEDLTNLNYINSILFTPYRPEHDLEVFVEAPSNILLGQSAVLNATVYNFGTNNETNVQLQLLINNATADSVVIPELLAGFTYTLSYAWAPIEEGSYIVTAYATPVPGENITANNMATSIVYVIAIENTFREDFSTPTLDPHWQVWRYPIRAPSPPDATYQQETGYSLTDTPGYLRYYLGSFTIEGASEPTWGGPSSPYWYYPSMHLYRMFESTDWTLEIQATYSSYSANAATQAFYVFYGDPQQRQDYRNNAIIVRASVWDAYHNVYVIENGVEKTVASLPINRYYDSFYYRIMRSGHQFTVQWSRDGVTYTTALTESLGSQIDSLPQGIGITGQAFYSYSDSYSQYDHIYLTPPPEHELAVSLEAPDYVILGQSVSLNATVSNLGLNDEANVQLQLLVDGSLVNSVVIPELLTSSSYRLSYLWTPTIEGNYNITAYAVPVPGETDPTNNQRTRVASVVRPLIQPIEGQRANYTITLPYGTLLLNTTYSYYVTPIQMDVYLWMRDPYGNTGINWLLLNILNRQVEAGMWAGYAYPLWIEPDVTVGSTVRILERSGTVTGSRFIEMGEYLVDCWELQFQYYDMSYSFWFDKANGLVTAVRGTSPYGTEEWTLTATNVPLVYLPRLRIQLTPQSGTVGTEVTVTGVNAMLNSTLEIYWDNTHMGMATADEHGSFTFTLTVPPSTRDVHTITATDLTTGISDTKVFTVLSSISIAPVSGPMGTKVQVTGFGFGANEHVILTFEDMQIAEITADDSGSFTATCNIPLAQNGQYQVKAWYGDNYVQTTFTVTEVSELDVNIDVGAIYFKGETAEFYVQTAFYGKPIDVTTMNATLYMYDGTTRTLTYQRIATGFYRVRYTISGKTGMTGTYTLFVEAGAITNTVKAYGTSIKTFLVKPTWEKEAPKIAALSLTSIGLVSAMVMLWRKEKKKLI